jgi:ABC-2 type transport system permease protein
MSQHEHEPNLSPTGAPGWLRGVAHVLPLWWLNDGMTDVVVRGQAWTSALVPGLVLASFALVVSALAAKLFRWETI